MNVGPEGVEPPDVAAQAARLAHRALEGAVFPLEREQLVWVARENDAEPGWLSWLSQLAPRLYGSLEEVATALVSVT